MICDCGGWQYVGVAEIGNRERAVLICIECGKKEPVTGSTPLVTKSMVAHNTGKAAREVNKWSDYF